jgi:hypothetical protein
MRRHSVSQYQPFIEDPRHLRELDGQRFVVLRVPQAASRTYGQLQETVRQRLSGLPVSFPARAHVTLCGFATGTALDVVREVVRAWAHSVAPLVIEIERERVRCALSNRHHAGAEDARVVYSTDKHSAASGRPPVGPVNDRSGRSMDLPHVGGILLRFECSSLVRSHAVHRGPASPGGKLCSRRSRSCRLRRRT